MLLCESKPGFPCFRPWACSDLRRATSHLEITHRARPISPSRLVRSASCYWQLRNPTASAARGWESIGLAPGSNEPVSSLPNSCSRNGSRQLRRKAQVQRRNGVREGAREQGSEPHASLELIGQRDAVLFPRERHPSPNVSIIPSDSP